MQGHDEDRHIDRITIKTMDEAVVAGPTLVDLADCEESGEAGACVVTAAMLNGTAIVSIHDSKATLRSVFVPLVIQVTDTGKFKIKPEPGTVIAGERELTSFSGKLTVEIASFGQLVSVGLISITDAKVKYVSLIHEHDDENNDEDDEKKKNDDD
jgi:hypothetical protein